MNKASKILNISIVISLVVCYIFLTSGYGITWAQTQSGDVQTEQVIFDVLFEADNNDISSETKDGLNQHADSLISNPEIVATLEGYSDSTGSDDYNFALSGQRAQSVKDYLISLGVPSENLSIVPKGGTDRFASGETREALASNRRVRLIYNIPVVIAHEPVVEEETSEETFTTETAIQEPLGEETDEGATDTDEADSELTAAEAPLPVATPKPPPPTPPPSLLKLIGSEINQSAPGEIIFEPPRSMLLQGTYLVEALVSKSFIDGLTSALNDQPQADKLKLSQDMLVLLTGNGFEVQPVEESFNSRELFPDDHGARSESVAPVEDIKWQWYVTPVKAGYQPLLLSVIVDIEEPVYDQASTEYETYTKLVKVREGLLRSLVGSYWITSFVVLLVIAVASWVILGKFNMI